MHDSMVGPAWVFQDAPLIAAHEDAGTPVSVRDEQAPLLQAKQLLQMGRIYDALVVRLRAEAEKEGVGLGAELLNAGKPLR
jgi:hypothetical protein